MIMTGILLALGQVFEGTIQNTIHHLGDGRCSPPSHLLERPDCLARRLSLAAVKRYTEGGGGFV